MKLKKPKETCIIGYMPTLNTGATLEKTINAIPKGWLDELFIVDNASTDETTTIAKKLKIHAIIHSENRGYGGSQKTGYQEALKMGADIIVMIHSDYQYDPSKIPNLVIPIIEGEYDLMLGSRIRSRKEALAGGMPLYKYISNRALTLAQNITYGLSLSEYHTGLRAFSRRSLLNLPFTRLSNNWVFDQQILASAIALGLRIGEVQVPVRYFDESSSISFRSSLVYGLGTLGCLLRFLLCRNSFYTDPIFQRANDQPSV